VSETKKIGIIGGLGPASTIEYYRDIIENYRKTYGDDCYPEIVIESVNMHEFISCIKAKDYQTLAEKIIRSIVNLEKAGAAAAAIASNSPHVAWDLLKDKVNIPVISILDATCDFIIEHRYQKVLIFATEFTMKNGMYGKALSNRNIDWVLPDEADIEILGNIIYPNLENGIVIAEDKERMIQIAEKNIEQYHCDALLLGCTEIPLMIKEKDVSVPIINTAQIHIRKISDYLMV
jgi:aspartate racemase